MAIKSGKPKKIQRVLNRAIKGGSLLKVYNAETDQTQQGGSGLAVEPFSDLQIKANGGPRRTISGPATPIVPITSGRLRGGALTPVYPVTADGAYDPTLYLRLKANLPADPIFHLPFLNESLIDVAGNRSPSTESGGIIFPSYNPLNGRAVQLAEATTNLFTNPILDIDATNIILAQAGGSTAERITTDSFIGGGCIELITNAANDLTQFFHNFAITLAAGTTVTLQAMVKSPGGTGQWRWLIKNNANDFLQPDGATWGASSDGPLLSFDRDNQWRFVTLTFDTAVGSSSLTVVGMKRSAGAASQSLRIDALQVEEKDYPTPLCVGSFGTGHSWSGAAHASTSNRTETDLRYALNMTDQFSLVARWMPFTIPSEHTNYVYVLDWRGDADNYLRVIYRPTNDNLYVAWEGATIIDTINTAPGSDLTRFREYSIIVTYDKPTLAFYLDGEIVGSPIAVTDMGVTPSEINLGCQYANANHANGYMKETAILDYVLTPAQVALLSA